MAVITVIELDDKSHNTNLGKVMARDLFLEKACNSAGLKLVRFDAKASYKIQKVREKIEAASNS